MIDFLSASKKGCVQEPSTEKEDKAKEGLRQTAKDWPVRMRYHESMMFIAAMSTPRSPRGANVEKTPLPRPPRQRRRNTTARTWNFTYTFPSGPPPRGLTDPSASPVSVEHYCADPGFYLPPTLSWNPCWPLPVYLCFWQLRAGVPGGVR